MERITWDYGKKEGEAVKVGKSLLRLSLPEKF
jgi:hypothetical protein